MTRRASIIRYSTRGMIVLVGWVAVVCALFSIAFETTVVILFTVNIVTLVTAAACAIYGNIASRAFCVGFVLFGVSYLAAIYFQDSHRLLVTSNLLGYLKPDRPWDPISWNGNSYSAFEAIGELVLTLFFAGLGGTLTRHLNARQTAIANHED